MELASFFAYCIALGIAAAIPGPGVAAIVSRSLGTGFKRTVPMVFGLILGDIAYLILAVGGLSVLAKTFSEIFFVIKILGAAYLLWLAWKFWTTGIETSAIQKSAGRRDNWQAFLGGFAVTMGNPKTIIFYMALLPTVIDLQSAGVFDCMVLALLTMLVLLIVIMPYAALAARTRELFVQPKSLKILSRSAASALALTAGWIVART